MFTTEMIQLFAVVLGKDSQKVTEALLRQGCMQFVKTSELDGQTPGQLSEAKSDVLVTDISDLRKRIEGFLHTGGIVPATPVEADLNNRVDVNVDKENSHLDQITAQRAAIREKQKTIHQEILKLEDIRRQVELYGVDVTGVKLPAKSSLISMQIGAIPASNVKQLERDLRDVLSLTVTLGIEGDVAHYLLISLKRDSQSVGKVLSKTGWTNVELPSQLRSINKNVFGEMSSKLKTLNGEQKKLESKANDIVKTEATRLKETWVNLRVNELFYKIQDNFDSSSRTVIFTGWLPSSKEAKLTEEITKACQGQCYLEWNQAKSKEAIGDDVPVQFDNPSILAPFQMLVSNFGIPRYGTIDPTPFVMPLYLAMFGLMFADVGQGLVLAALGLWGACSFKKNEQKKGLYNLSWLIVWCGFSSVCFGALFGSYFGADLFKPIWFDFHGVVSGHSGDSTIINSIYDILSITIYFGISVIAIGLIFNWINLIRTRMWMELFFDKGGIIGGWIYGAGVYVAAYFVMHDYKQFPSANLLFLLIGLPCLLLFVKEPYHFVKHESFKSGKKFNPLIILNFLLQWIVELLEIFSGYLSNTLSFMRVAGLGIAHVCLMISIFTLAEMTSGIGSVIILILGNILVICLEGLTAGIQALRLSYYEFFTKFFHGSGQLYTPISLNSSYR
ncbi:MAG: V-type ATP synthase subunit I [Planctomycetota bacterium]|jgi:V/A-type H+-transporting ATPase subunit I